MNCAKMKELLVDYTEDSLSGRKKLAVERHLSRCETCRSERSKIEELKKSLLSLRVPERDDEFWQDFNRKLSQRLAGEKGAATTRRPAWRLAFSLGAAAAVLILLAWAVMPGFHTRERSGTIDDIASAPETETTGGVDDLEVQNLAYPNGDMRLALADLSLEEVEHVDENAFLLIEESWESTGDVVLENSYEESIYDFVEDLSAELSLEEYEEVYEQLESI